MRPSIARRASAWREIRHGSWSYVADAGRDPVSGKRRQVRASGFATKTEAEAALAELADQTAKGITAHDERQTVETFLRAWIEDKAADGLRPTTQRSYRHYIDDYLGPHLGRIRLKDLRPSHVEAMLREIAKPRPNGKRIGPASVRRVHATLSSAMATAKRRRLISYNPATDVDLPSAPRPRVHPWEPAELGSFLDLVASDPFGPIYEVIAATGLRRGEAAGCAGTTWTSPAAC